jgi:hypothetical protein
MKQNPSWETDCFSAGKEIPWTYSERQFMTLLIKPTTDIYRPSEPLEFFPHFLILFIEDKFWYHLSG